MPMNLTAREFQRAKKKRTTTYKLTKSKRGDIKAIFWIDLSSIKNSFWKGSCRTSGCKNKLMLHGWKDGSMARIWVGKSKASTQKVPELIEIVRLGGMREAVSLPWARRKQNIRRQVGR